MECIPRQSFTLNCDESSLCSSVDRPFSGSEVSYTSSKDTVTTRDLISHAIRTDLQTRDLQSELELLRSENMRLRDESNQLCSSVARSASHNTTPEDTPESATARLDAFLSSVCPQASDMKFNDAQSSASETSSKRRASAPAVSQNSRRTLSADANTEEDSTMDEWTRWKARKAARATVPQAGNYGDWVRRQVV